MLLAPEGITLYRATSSNPCSVMNNWSKVYLGGHCWLKTLYNAYFNSVAVSLVSCLAKPFLNIKPPHNTLSIYYAIIMCSMRHHVLHKLMRPDGLSCWRPLRISKQNMWCIIGVIYGKWLIIRTVVSVLRKTINFLDRANDVVSGGGTLCFDDVKDKLGIAKASWKPIIRDQSSDSLRSYGAVCDGHRLFPRPPAGMIVDWGLRTYLNLVIPIYDSIHYISFSLSNGS